MLKVKWRRKKGKKCQVHDSLAGGFALSERSFICRALAWVLLKAWALVMS